MPETPQDELTILRKLADAEIEWAKWEGQPYPAITEAVQQGRLVSWQVMLQWCREVRCA